MASEKKYSKFAEWINNSGLHFLILIMSISFVILLFWPRIVITILPGERGVQFKRFSGGTDVHNFLDEGTTLIWPWNYVYRYNVRQQVLPHEMHALSVDGLDIGVHLSTRYQAFPDSIGKLHKIIGPNYLEVVVRPEVESSTREILNQISAEGLYTARWDSVENMILTEVNKEIRKQFSIRSNATVIPDQNRVEVGDIERLVPYNLYVNVFEVNIVDVTLPEEISQAIEKKIKRKQEHLAYEYILLAEEAEADRKRIEALGVKDFEDISNISILKWRGLSVTSDLATSENAKVVVVGTEDLPIILGSDGN